MIEFILSSHAQKRIKQRKIKREWIVSALESPDEFENDVDDFELCHAIKKIPEKGFNRLRVVYNETKVPWLIVTAYFE